MRLSFSKGQPVERPINIILASQSIGRKMLLDKLSLRFRVVVAHVKEEEITDPDPITMIKRRAAAKAEEIVNHPRVYGIAPEEKSLVIAADSMAIVGKEVFGKSKDRNEAKEMLRRLMGRTHTFATAVNAVYIVEGIEKKHVAKIVKTRVTMRKMNPAEMESYVTRYDFTRYAAAYAINEAPWHLVTRIDGSYTNVIGLPFEVLIPILRTLKIIS